MHRVPILLLFLALAACSGGKTVQHLEGVKWGNSAQPCSVNYATFNGGFIAVHPFGQTLLMYKIVKITPSWSSPDEVAVRIEPSAEMEKTLPDAERAQVINFYEQGFELNLRVKEKRVQIASVTVAGDKRPVKGAFTMFNMFDCDRPS